MIFLKKAAEIELFDFQGIWKRKRRLKLKRRGMRANYLLFGKGKGN